MVTNHPNPEALATVRAFVEHTHLTQRHGYDKVGIRNVLAALDTLSALLENADSMAQTNAALVKKLQAISAAQVPEPPLVKLKEAFEAGRKWQREMATPQVPLPNCDVCKQPQTALGALHFSPPDANSMCKKTHICVKCEAAPQVPEGNGQRIIDGLKDAVAYAKGDKSKETSETFNAVPQVSRDVDEYRSALIEISKETAYSGQSGYPTQGALIAQCAIATENLHADDIAVNSFARHMAAKMAKSRAKGRSGWNNKDECTAEHLSQLLIGHLEKGDPVDVANFCMMLHQRGERIVIAAERSASDRLREALTRLMPLAEEACDEHSERPEDNVDIMFARETIASRRS